MFALQRDMPVTVASLVGLWLMIVAADGGPVQQHSAGRRNSDHIERSRVAAISLPGGQPTGNHQHHPSRPGRPGSSVAVPAVPAGVCTLSIRGIPKSGTTWMEVVLERMLALACAAAPPCVYSSNSGHVRASGSGDSSHDTARGGMAAPLPAGNCTGVRFVMVTKHRIAGTLLTNFGHKRMPIESPSIVAGLAMERCVGRGIPAHSRACFDAIDVLGTGPDRLDGVDKDQMLYFNIMRDPRAVAVSACHYFQPQQPLARCPYIHPPAFAANVAVAAVDWAYWDLRHPDFTITMHYENATAAPGTEFARLAAFLGIALTRADMAEVVSGTSVDEMVHLKMPGRHDPGVKVRRGSRWGFLAELDTTVVAAMNATMATMLPPELLSVYEICL